MEGVGDNRLVEIMEVNCSVHVSYVIAVCLTFRWLYLLIKIAFFSIFLYVS